MTTPERKTLETPERSRDPLARSLSKELDQMFPPLNSPSKTPHEPKKSLIGDYTGSYLRFGKMVEVIRRELTPARSWKTIIYVFYGLPGTGKTRLAAHMSIAPYWKMPHNEWWDGYDPAENEDIIWDDWRPSQQPFTFMLNLCDRYPLLVNIKGTTSQFTAKRIFITSPRNPLEAYRGVTDENLYQLQRRTENISHFYCFRGQSVIRDESSSDEYRIRELPEWLRNFDEFTTEEQELMQREEKEKLDRVEQQREEISSRAAGFNVLTGKKSRHG
jgi:hypothetical protein